MAAMTQVCVKCQKPIVGRISPDPDVMGVGYCRSHRKQAKLIYMLLMGESEHGKRLAQSIVNNWAERVAKRRAKDGA